MLTAKPVSPLLVVVAFARAKKPLAVCIANAVVGPCGDEPS